MKIIGVIPARYASTRFPAKPLIDIGGKSMIQRVVEQAKKSKSLQDVVVATDDERIEQHVKSFGGNVVMTSELHQSGTDRCFEAIRLFCPSADVVINIQGDEPFIHPEQIDLVASCFGSGNTEIATLVKKISENEELFNINIPKVAINKRQEAMLFSRQTIPHIRGKKEEEWLRAHTFYKHIGIYAYRTDILAQLTALKQSSLELAESLEQLRWLENGYKIKVEITDFESVAVDTPEDLKKLSKFL
ncbi:MAG TPA: 3-deoxy-manno-octulosonate cytidylyltransferase [Bacteroidia bacterium]|jgi:3-deoxy-manno-octulosonate cytidylyltransferase (CMP-KDO synthetase)